MLLSASVKVRLRYGSLFLWIKINKKQDTIFSSVVTGNALVAVRQSSLSIYCSFFLAIVQGNFSSFQHSLKQVFDYIFNIHVYYFTSRTLCSYKLSLFQKIFGPSQKFLLTKSQLPYHWQKFQSSQLFKIFSLYKMCTNSFFNMVVGRSKMYPKLQD